MKKRRFFIMSSWYWINLMMDQRFIYNIHLQVWVLSSSFNDIGQLQFRYVWLTDWILSILKVKFPLKKKWILYCQSVCNQNLFTKEYDFYIFSFTFLGCFDTFLFGNIIEILWTELIKSYFFSRKSDSRIATTDVDMLWKMWT